MTNHTPGPWKAAHRQGADGNYRTEVFSDEYGGIATCDWTKKHCGNGVTATYREANALLIAAAPDLLEALQKFPGFLCGTATGDMWIEDMRAAIAKATGESK